MAHEDGRDLAERPPPGAAAQDLTLVLGGVARVALDGRSMPLERKAAGLLAWLALEGPTPRERVASLLWPNGPPEAARNSLRQLLFRVRKAGGPGLLEPGE